MYNSGKQFWGKIMNETIEEMNLRFEGSDEIQIETLSEALKGTLETLKCLTEESIEEGGYRKFIVKNVTKGSFIVQIWSIVSQNPQQTFTTVVTALTAFKGILEIHKHLKGEKPKSVESINSDVYIKNVENLTLVVDKNVYDKISNTDDIEHGINRLFKALNKDENRGDVVIDFKTENKTESVKIARDEFPILEQRIDLEPITPSNIEDIIDTPIRLGKVDFTGNSKWTIYLGNNKEQAYMLDQIFLESVQKGEVLFGTSTVLHVKLKCRYSIDSDGTPITSRKAEYSIMEVYRVDNHRQVNESMFN